ncbi:hypothetical protein G7Y89_g9181 [Cudoniella acicularis]|uniref:Peptidase S8/S53 domain-containing protein n=1 Tax=Cudoniella acicularis TaxID=354080 RepID=A0A8H4RF56_9HELO|nr:hypothetical protein G7Y89_g9181 [Cudoniella acicularis]
MPKWVNPEKEPKVKPPFSPAHQKVIDDRERLQAEQSSEVQLGPRDMQYGSCDHWPTKCMYSEGQLKKSKYCNWCKYDDDGKNGGIVDVNQFMIHWHVNCIDPFNMRKYEDVQALLICWETVTSTFLKQREGLEDVLKSPYRFGTTPFNIPLENDPFDSLTDEIRNFKKIHNKEQNLLIIYYGDHGIIGEKGDLILKCYSGEKLIFGEYVRWNRAQERLLSGSKADILIILDCCHSASAIEPDYESRENAVDILVASSIDGKAPLREEYSLTHKLTAVLQSPDLYVKGFSTWFLHKRLVRHQNISVQSNLMKSRKDAELGATPLLFPFEPKRKENPFIFLKPLKGNESDEGDEGDYNDEFDNGGTTAKEPLARKQGRLEGTIFSIEIPTNTEHGLEIRVRVDYTDATTNTDPELAAKLAPGLRAKADAEYADAATNTEAKITLQEAPPERIQRGGGELIRLQSSVSSQPYQLPLSIQLWVSRTQISRKRKMGDDTSDTSDTEDRQRWFDRYERWAVVYDQRRRDSFRRCKIALLCTGVSTKEDKFLRRLRLDERRRRIFVKDFSDVEGHGEDRHGMGTQCVKLIARLNSSAELHVAKISDEGEISDLSVISEAILHYAHENVNMIVLPFGFPIHHERVSTAISFALEKGITCLAAPGNAGGNERAAFPARMPRVIAIYATDGYGNPSLFNAAPMKGRKNFSAIGEIMPSSWNGVEVKTSSTSYSVCVAAAVLATMFEFARTQLSLDDADLKTLNSPDGAEKMLELMSSERGGYDYIAPWLFFSDKAEDSISGGSEFEFKSIIKGQILAVLRQMR